MQKPTQDGVRPINPEAAAQYADLLEAAAGCFRMFQSLVESGFTEAQALQLVGSTLGGQR